MMHIAAISGGHRQPANTTSYLHCFNPRSSHTQCGDEFTSLPGANHLAQMRTSAYVSQPFISWLLDSATGVRVCQCLCSVPGAREPKYCIAALTVPDNVHVRLIEILQRLL